jgi:polysaccharide deacetylase 2 family uncharacterized protein YibQ
MPARPPAWRLPARIGAGLLLAVGLGLLGSWWLGPGVPARYRDLPSAEGELPRSESPSRPNAPAPWAAVVVLGVGLAETATRAAIALPPEIGLAFSPYARRLGEWQAQAEAAGHEIWAELPMEPADPSRTDAGERALRPRQDEADRLATLDWILGRLSDPTGLVADPGAFAEQPEAFAPLARVMARRDLDFVELGGSRLQGVVGAGGARHAVADIRLDVEATPDAVDRTLGELSALARSRGGVIAHAYAHPSTLARLTAWVHRAADEGLRLVTVGEAITRSAANERDMQ